MVREPESIPMGESVPVKVYQVNEELEFVVISVKGIDWAKKGSAVLLANDREPVATVQLTELDQSGFAVAEITHKMDPMTHIQKGETLFARQLLRPVPE